MRHMCRCIMQATIPHPALVPATPLDQSTITFNQCRARIQQVLTLKLCAHLYRLSLVLMSSNEAYWIS
jgi:hypothetical protein